MKVYLEGAGDVIIERSDRAGCLRITISHDSVRVAVPRGVPLVKGRAFALDRLDWICRHTARLQCNRKVHDELVSDLPPITDREGARRSIIMRCEKLAQETGFTYNRVAVRSQKKRWGSCSSRNNINLNIKLVRLPQELMDYVILHELVHTRIKSHGKVFWDELDKYVGDSKVLRTRLQQYILPLL
jgi:predicted metal-dependent hydrolase